MLRSTPRGYAPPWRHPSAARQALDGVVWIEEAGVDFAAQVTGGACAAPARLLAQPGPSNAPPAITTAGILRCPVSMPGIALNVWIEAMWIRRSRKRQLWHCLFCLAVATTSAATARTDESRTLGGDPPILSGRPTDVHDGDTFRFGATRIRIAGVDAPELDTRYGPAARSALIAAIGGSDVVCADTGARSYRRVVARCTNAQGQDLSAVMARSGWAVDWRSFSCGSYLADERDARRARRGMYAYGVQPWRERPPYARQCGVNERDRRP